MLSTPIWDPSSSTSSSLSTTWNLVTKFFANSRKNDFRAKPEVTRSLFGKRQQPGQADLCESPFRQVKLADLGFELGDLGFELGEFDVWTSASPHLVKSTSQSGESEDNDILVGLIGHSMLMQKGPLTADRAAPSQRRRVLGTRTQRV